MFARFKRRSEELEHIDKGDYTPDEYEGCLVELRRVNRFLGDTHILKRTFLADIGRAGLKNFSVLDVGAGSGELLRVAAEWAGNNDAKAQLVGLDLNERSATAILEESEGFVEIEAVRGDAVCLPFADDSFDYGVSSLFTHHLTDDQFVMMLRELARVARRTIFVIDLHRHPVAYFLYTTVGHLVLYTRLLREDGALSILRSFKPLEMRALAERANLSNITVERKFPFRLVLRARKHAGRINPEAFERKPVDKQSPDHREERVA